MPTLTALILLAFASYVGTWIMGHHEGNFALLMLLATLISGVYWVLEKKLYAPRRLATAQALAQQQTQRYAELKAQGLEQIDLDQAAAAQQNALRQPWWLDWTAGLFPVIAAVFIFRSFLFEPFKIPSGSMIPTLWIGDLILVNKYHYGLRLPVINKKIVAGALVQRGDVMVFRYPPQPSLDYIKRVVGLPGDEIAYLNKQLSINGQPVPKESIAEFFNTDALSYAKQFAEQLPTGTADSAGPAKTINLLNDDTRPAFIQGADDFPFKDHCRYSIEGVQCKVPAGHYFMMGDNRDNSLDSRYFGFVPEANIVGKAVYIWFNFSHLGRIGQID